MSGTLRYGYANAPSETISPHCVDVVTQSDANLTFFVLRQKMLCSTFFE